MRDRGVKRDAQLLKSGLCIKHGIYGSLDHSVHEVVLSLDPPRGQVGVVRPVAKNDLLSRTFRGYGGVRVLQQEVTFMVQHGGRVGLDGIEVSFDDERAVANAGIAVVATLAQRLGVERVIGVPPLSWTRFG